MGVPAFYRWLSERYPKIVLDLLEAKSVDPSVPLDLTKPSPNQIEFDNLYIDMNGIIHPCSHPEDRPAPKTEEEMFRNVCYYVDRLFAAVRPRKLLFLAIDGVAPRAKMNQQRARRFKAVKEIREKEEAMDEVRKEMVAQGMKVPPKPAKAWDSNVITPGTPFMDRLAKYLRFYIAERQNRVPAWKNVMVLLSDSNEPGEGEHKIMIYIRAQRSLPGYDPNQKHILHGLDADLIMLALATHEADFTILREEVLFGRKKAEARQRARKAKEDALNAMDGHSGEPGLPNSDVVTMKPLQMLRVPVLREYLRIEFDVLSQPGVLPFPYDFERIVDDFVFLCFFVGNDFLPHLPSLDIREGAITFLFDTYRRLLPGIGDYLTAPGGHVNLNAVDVILAEVGRIEDEVFRRKFAEEQSQRRHDMERKATARAGGRDMVAMAAGEKMGLFEAAPGDRKRGRGGTTSAASSATEKDNQSAAAHLRKRMLSKMAKPEDGAVAEPGNGDAQAPAADAAGNDAESAGGRASKRVKREAADGTPDPAPQTSTGFVGDAEDAEDPEDAQEKSDDAQAPAGGEEAKKAQQELDRRMKAKERVKLDKLKVEVAGNDKVRLHEAGWRDRYYLDKYSEEQDIVDGPGRQRIFKAYIEGLCWVMAYYYRGCASWGWFYPFHYAPFASDLVNIESYGPITFQLGEPFTPLAQLMAVLPPQSCAALPEPLQRLMLDGDSPIKSFYPEDVKTDPNGKAMPWLHVVLLPFIDADRLLGAMEEPLTMLSPTEVRRNTRGATVLALHRSHALAQNGVMTPGTYADFAHLSFPEATAGPEEGQARPGELPPGLPGGFGGRVFAFPPTGPLAALALGARIRAPLDPPGVFTDVASNEVCSFAYLMPAQSGTHRSALLQGAQEAAPSLLPNDRYLRTPKLSRGLNMADLAKNYLNNHGASHKILTASAQGSFSQRDPYRDQGAKQHGQRGWGSFQPQMRRRQPALVPPGAAQPYPAPYTPYPATGASPAPYAMQPAQQGYPAPQPAYPAYAGHHQQPYGHAYPPQQQPPPVQHHGQYPPAHAPYGQGYPAAYPQHGAMAQPAAQHSGYPGLAQPAPAAQPQGHFSFRNAAPGAAAYGAGQAPPGLQQPPPPQQQEQGQTSQSSLLAQLRQAMNR